MAELDKVIKGITHCLSRYVDGLCDDCPYVGELDKSYMIPMKCKEIIMRDALKLLKEQIPQLVDDKQEVGGVLSAFCPSCGRGLYDNNLATKYCYNCRQAVKWE